MTNIKKLHLPFDCIPLAILAISHSGISIAGDFETLPRNLHNIPGPGMHQATGANAPGTDPFSLLMNSREIQRDLQLTDEQLHKLSSLGKFFRTQMEESSFRSTTDVQQQTLSGQKMIGKVLDAHQLDRFRQILLQQQGPCELLRDQQAMQHLKIDPVAQFQQISTICSRQDEQIRIAAASSNKNHPTDTCLAREITYHDTQKIKTAAQNQITQFLNASQLNILNEMKGRPLELIPIFCHESARS